MIKPVSNFLLLKEKPKEEKSKGGLFLAPTPDKNFKTPQGVILDVGKDVKDYKKGDTVVYNIGYVNEVSHKLEDYLLIRDEYILAIIK